MAELHFAERILWERLRRGWEQKDLAQRLGLHQGSVSRFETEQDSPSLATVQLFAEAFGMEVYELLQRPGEVPEPLLREGTRAHEALYRELVLLPEVLAQVVLDHVRALNVGWRQSLGLPALTAYTCPENGT